MAETLYSIDLAIFYLINHGLSSSFLDKFFSLITNVNNWYIAYVILLLICFIKGGKRGKIAALLVIILIVVTDQLGHKVIKEIVQRLRPCNALADAFIPLGCQGTFSFPSNHATNNFAAATFFYVLYPKLKWALFISAFLVAISRVYLGLHYPSDIAGGAIIGSAFGYVFARGALWLEKYFNNRDNKFQRIK